MVADWWRERGRLHGAGRKERKIKIMEGKRRGKRMEGINGRGRERVKNGRGA